MSTGQASDELDDLPGAVDLDPGYPRLVGCGPGRLAPGAYDLMWQLRREDDCAIIEPRRRTYRATARFFLVLGILIPVGGELVGRRLLGPADDRLLWMLGIPLPGIALLIGAAIVHRWGRSETAKGPMFRYCQQRADFELLRINRTIPRTQIVRLELITGAWVQSYGRLDPGESYSNWATELHLIVRLKNDKLVRLPLLGTQGTVVNFMPGLGRDAMALSETMGVPLERIKESAAFFDPYPQIRERLRNGLCPQCGAELPPTQAAPIFERSAQSMAMEVGRVRLDRRARRG